MVSPHFLHTRTFLPSTSFLEIRTGLMHLGQTSIRLDRWMPDSFSTIPPWRLVAVGFWWIFTVLSFSTKARDFLGRILSKRPVFPFSLPAITITESFFRRYVLTDCI